MNFEGPLESERGAAIRVDDAARLHDWSLVLSAVGIAHFVENGEACNLWVSSDRLEAARHQIYLYEEENRAGAAAAERYRDEHSYNPPTLLVMLLFILFFYETGPWQSQSIWFGQGAVDRQAIVDGRQWWRLVTALTLHSDVMHLVGNMAFGGGIIHLLCKVVGTGLGWFLVLLAGLGGNLVNVLLHRGQHLSVGFSTAVFGAVGILCGLELVRRRHGQGILLVVGAGLGLLAMLGSGGERVDLGAHLWGFGVGICLGALAAVGRHVRGRYPGFHLQLVMFFSVVVVVWLAWRQALDFG
ncbi:MAG: rhomboid family intramembrane serine protease [Desulfobulbaceae bacterium]|nr:MAG: rhomboid family intramembrane serine protease [Desulfobulbaceae bacterium]